MHQTTNFDLDYSVKILINTTELQALLSCGRASAVKLGMEAQARVEVGKRVLWNLQKVQQYLLQCST